jgi:hypothetical protein
VACLLALPKENGALKKCARPRLKTSFADSDAAQAKLSLF